MDCRILTLSLVVLAQSVTANAADFTPVGDIAGDGFQTLAYAVSADGSTVVGFDRTEGDPNYEGQAFVWTRSGIVGLGDFPGGRFYSWGRSVSGDGSVVIGTGTTEGGIDFRWTSGDGMVEMDGAVAVSGDGATIVGSLSNEAVLFGQTGDVVHLGDLVGGVFSSEANAVSADGSVVVGNGTTSAGDEAFRWTNEGGLEGLGYLPSVPFRERSVARSVSADGSTVVGFSSRAHGYEAFRWTREEGMVGLGFLAADPGYFESTAQGVSSDGSIIVGEGISESKGRTAAIWDPVHGMRELDELLKSLGLAAQLDGWRLWTATGVSADGRVIVGYGTNPDGEVQGWVADLAPDLQCDVAMSQASYVDGETVVITSLRFRNANSSSMATRLRLQLTIPIGSGIVANAIDLGADGSFAIPANFDKQLGPVTMFTLSPQTPLRGDFEWRCAFEDPATGRVISEDRVGFTLH